jgi:glycosyltransferase involved in cell wall biosynthesis
VRYTLKKKILFVNGHLNVGGVENSLLNVLKNIDYQKYEVDLILFEDTGDYENEIPKDVNIHFFDLTKTSGPIFQCFLNNINEKNFFALSFRIILLIDKIIGPKSLILAKHLFKKIEYDCAIAYRIGMCTDFVGYVINSKKKVTWWHHGEFNYSNETKKRWEYTFKKFDKIVAVSDSSQEMLISNIEGISNKTITIPNIINQDSINMMANKELSQEFNNRKCFTLASVGRLSPEKGMINCVHTCKRLIDNGYNVQWYLIGEGPQRVEIEKFIKEYKIEKNIILLGALSNPYPYIKHAQIYVHPSFVESLSISVLEALSLNTPVIVAKSMGPMEFICHKQNGFFVEPTPDGLFKGIVTLISDKGLYNQLKKDKRDLLKNYSKEIVMDKIYQLIEGDNG